MRGGMFSRKSSECESELISLREQNESLSQNLVELSQEHGACIREREGGLTEAEQKVKQRYDRSLLFRDAPSREGETFVRGDQLFTIIDGKEVLIPKRQAGFGTSLLADAYENIREEHRAKDEAIHQHRVRQLTALNRRRQEDPLAI